jgi:cyclopropane-fatty-acyl-phospholipid synthase
MLQRQAETWRDAGGLPLCVVLPDGSTVEFGSSVKVTLRIRDAAWLCRLPKLTLGALGDAFVHGQVDVDGDLLDALPVGVQLAEGTGTSAFARISESWRRHRLLRTGPRSCTTMTSATTYALWLDQRMIYSCAYFAPAKRPTRRSGPSLTTSAASCCCRRASACWTSAAAGADW